MFNRIYCPEARPLEICEAHLAPNICIIPHGSNSPIVEQLEFWLCKVVDWVGSIFASLALHDQIIARPTGRSRRCCNGIVDGDQDQAEASSALKELDALLGRRMVQQVSTPETSKPPTVLLIDDNCEDRTYWSASLKNPPFEFIVLEAACGESGFKLCQSQHVDCVVLDLEMPESGLFTLLRLIPDPTRKHVPVVILTKLAQPSLIKLMKSLGAYEVLVKEYCSAETLADTIRQAIA